ncbi:MAG TPA: Rrf2 family transcriptional regulator [Candidatus Hydrogenedentes bacterium]|nr:Rrf2 family transcriptional regulator [Candidatus Hydrogenedentota bacterium]
MLSKTAIHAVNALVELARLDEQEYAGAAKLAEKIHAPQNYLGKLLQTLAQAGLVHGQKGLGGGFRLARRPEEITLYDVVEPIDHVSRWSGCLMSQGTCSEGDPCPMHREWAVVREKYFKMLHGSTIATIASRREARSRAD